MLLKILLPQKMGINITAKGNANLGTWDITDASGRKRRKYYASAQTSEWGTRKKSPSEILDAALNSRTIRITWKDEDGKTHVDEEGTTAANEKVKQLKQAFKQWIWTEKERTERLLSLYNDKYNVLAPRKFDGKHLTLPVSPELLLKVEPILATLLNPEVGYVPHCVLAHLCDLPPRVRTV